MVNISQHLNIHNLKEHREAIEAGITLSNKIQLKRSGSTQHIFNLILNLMQAIQLGIYF